MRNFIRRNIYLICAALAMIILGLAFSFCVNIYDDAGAAAAETGEAPQAEAAAAETGEAPQAEAAAAETGEAPQAEETKVEASEADRKSGASLEGAEDESMFDALTEGLDVNTQPETDANETKVMSESEAETTEEAITPAEYLIKDFTIILQKPELPTGCEITSATMVLNYLGFKADKVTMAENYLPTVEDVAFYHIKNDASYGPDLYNYFLGNPENTGYICGPGAIVTALNDYFSDEKSTLSAFDYTGASADDLYTMVSQDIPVIVWITISLSERTVAETWYTMSGRVTTWGERDHCGVLIGYTEDSVTIADPISGITEYKKERFEEVFESRSGWCVAVECTAASSCNPVLPGSK